MITTRPFLLCAFAALAFSPRGATAQDAAQLAKGFDSDIRPLLGRYCLDCHTGEEAEAELDLAAFGSFGDVGRQPRAWQKVRQMLDNRQMPPEDADQPSDAQRQQLQDWVREFLRREAAKRAGDPGPVVLRRLSNAEYTYTIRDLTGVAALDPAEQFPVDGAAGEGFTNTGAALVMSPALVTKYLDAAKHVASHAVLLPDGIRFSPHNTRRDWTDESLHEIRQFYAQFADSSGGSAVNLQGIQFDTNQGGRLPVEKYLAALLTERDALRDGGQTIAAAARQHGLNAKYLGGLWQLLTARSQKDSSQGAPSPLLDDLRIGWQQAAEQDDAAALAGEIAQWQQALWKFNTVGHIGREGGATAWMTPVAPIAARQELRVELPASPSPEAAGEEIVVYLAAADCGDGRQHDYVLWQQPQLVLLGRPPILLRDVRRLTEQVRSVVDAELPRTRQYLQAAAELQGSDKPLEQSARRHQLNPRLLASWASYLKLGRGARPKITGHLTNKLTRAHGYEAVNGWGVDGTPSLLTNRSDDPVSFLTLTVPAHAVTVHPSPTRESIVAWQSPLEGPVRIAGLVADADDKCGNGAAWRLELQTTAGVEVLARGVIDNGGRQEITHEETVQVRPGDVISLVINARDNNHACDTTHVNLQITESGDDDRGRVWDLAADVVDNVLAGNPLPDSHGNAATWHFCASAGEPDAKQSAEIPADSALARWRKAVGRQGDEPPDTRSDAELQRLAQQVEHVLLAEDGRTDPLSDADHALREQLTSWRGPLDWIAAAELYADEPRADEPDADEPHADGGGSWGLDPSLFGRHPDGSPVDNASLCVQAPSVLNVRLPAQLAAGAELVTTGTLHTESAQDGSVQLQLRLAEIKPGELRLLPGSPIITLDGSPARRRIEAGLDEFRQWFPAALCYTKIVPVDEVVTLTLFYREDEHLQRLMLDDRQIAQLERMWDELRYVSREPLKMVVALEQLIEFATQDRPDLVTAFEPLRKPTARRAEAFRQRLAETEPAHLTALLELADRAWRRPLTDQENQRLRNLYGELRDSGLPPVAALGLPVARVHTPPAFLFRLEQPAPGRQAAPVSDLELASRLSYFLWSSLPDAELRRVAGRGELTDERVLAQQARRMLDDDRTRRLAVEFACQWLHIRGFDENDEKNEQLYPEFAELRDDMYEESVRFFEDMFRHDGDIRHLLDADHTFLNEALARHYGIDGVSGEQWRRVEGLRARGRGGVLAMATVLAKQSGASRTSPILRGNWVYETLLGQRLPRPPANVPQLPETVPSGLTARQLIERHSSDPACAKCHARIDPYGFALEQFDALGRLRPQPVDTRTKLLDGREIEGLPGLRDYLLQDRHNDFLQQFCRKLLGYALGRSVQLSDEPLLAEMGQRLKANGYRFNVAVEAIVTSRQFRDIRGREMKED